MNSCEQNSVVFLLTVDTEEEWDWNTDFPESDFCVSNVNLLPKFQSFCDQLGIRPSYFVDYAVANNSSACEALNIAKINHRCEIGAHLHPWCNPPYFGPTGEFESHVVNLSIEQVSQKLDSLVALIGSKFNVKPTSFRTGRWGINSDVLKMLIERGFLVDSSVYPFFENEHFSCKGSPLTPYWPSLSDPLQRGKQRQIMEIPVTAGFNRKNFDLCERVYQTLHRSPFKEMRMIGALWQSHLLRKIYLSPELSSSEDMLTLINTSLSKGNRVIHMYLHSSSLIDGVTGLLDANNAYETITQRIHHVINQLKQHYLIDFACVTEAYHQLKNTETLK